MHRTQISLTTAQAQRLRRIAAERGVSMAHVIRDAVDTYAVDDPSDRAERVRRARAVAGRFRSGLSDISERHDDYLAEDPTGW